MHEPIKMVVVSLLNVAILTIVLLFYRYVYPKKTIPLLPLLVLIAILPLVSMLRPGSYESGDLSEHIKLSIMFFNELSQGHIIPSWTDLGCSGYGCPVFSFIYILPYYLIAFLHILGFTFVDSTKLFLALSFIASGVTMYLWMKEEFGEKAGFIAGVFYLFAPYHLVDLHFRNAIGEMAAFALLPLCFLFTKKVLTEINKKWILFNATALGLLILSHLTATIIALPFLIGYGLLITKRKKQKWKKSFLFLGFSFLLGLLFTCFYWLPIAFEGKFIYWGVFGAITLYPINDLLFSPWRYGLLFQGPYGEHSHLIGYIHIIIVLYAFILLFKNKIKEKQTKILLWFFLIIFFGTIFMILPISQPLWDSIPLIKGFQFSYRLLIFSALCTSVIAAVILKDLTSKKLIFLICLVTIMLTILNWGNRRAVTEINDTVLNHQAFYKDIVASPITGPIWMNNNPKFWQKRITNNDKLLTISGKVETKMIKYTSTERIYRMRIHEDSLLVEQTFYYPEWQITANNQPVPIEIHHKDYPGLLVFTLKKGEYLVTVSLVDTLPRKTGKYVSFITITFTLFILSMYTIKKHFRKRRLQNE
ncbi:MAG TPA: 6-pyruvoyl-tetrahydropterin synthase-related protein [Patescibacteria group bacterium]|nr:6-pyruvoyl-tetrahydropterin synthase-related protein [Patescibacteria group bacterium]